MSEDPDPIVGLSADRRQPAGAQPQPDIPPYKIVFGANLKPAERVEDWSEGTRVSAVDKHSFTEFMAQSKDGATITIDVPNKISESPSNLEVTLSFGAISDFKAEEIASQVPPLKRLLSIRQLLLEAAEGKLDADAFRDGLSSLGVDPDYAGKLYDSVFASRGKEEPADTGSPVDKLLSLVDVESSDERLEKPENPILAKLVDAVKEDGSSVGADTAAAGSLVADITDLVSLQVSEITRHPELQQLESAWRGLKLLVDRFDFRSGLRLEVLPCSRDDANEAVYRQVLMREFSDEAPEIPVSLIVLDFAYSHSREDVERLEDLATTGASMQSPIVAALSPRFFGAENDTELTKLPLISQHVEGPDFVLWNKVREMKESEYVALALPAMLLRNGLWGRASIAVALAVASSYAETGWPTSILGRPIDDLPVSSRGSASSPLAVLIPDDKAGELAKAGMVALTAKPNSDQVELAKANTLKKPEHSDDLVARTAARVHATLPARLFICRAAHFLVALQNSVRSGDDPSATLETIKKSLRTLMRSRGQAAPEDSVSVEHVPEAKLPNDELWAVKLKAHRGILPKEVSAMMGLTTSGKYSRPGEEDKDASD